MDSHHVSPPIGRRNIVMSTGARRPAPPSRRVSLAPEGDLVLVLRMMVDSLLYTRNLVGAGKPTAEILTAINSVTTNLRAVGEAVTR